MRKILISVPDQLASRMKATIPPRQRSKTIVRLLEKEILRREKRLFDAALSVESDKQLNKEMQDWDITLDDGVEDETW